MEYHFTTEITINVITPFQGEDHLIGRVEISNNQYTFIDLTFRPNPKVIFTFPDLDEGKDRIDSYYSNTDWTSRVQDHQHDLYGY